MKYIKALANLALILLGITSVGYGMGIEVYKNDKLNLIIGGRLQLVGYGQYVNDPARSNGRIYLFLKQARLNVHGQVEGIKYNTEWVGAAEDVNGSNTGLTLLDYDFDVPVYHTESTWFKIGQFKVPYSRESLNDEAQFQFVEHSINFLGFNLGRDYGAAMHTYHGKWAAVGGLFTGGARDVPLRFIPERLGFPMFVARVGYNDGLDKDIFTVVQNDLHPQRTTQAAYLNAMYFRDTEIGHSTVLGARTTERSLMTNLNWNPFPTKGAPVVPPVAGIPATPSRISQGDFWQAGWDVAARGPMGNGYAWSTEAEADYARFSNAYGRIDLSGVRVQGGILKDKVEVAVRYSVLYPDPNFSISGMNITGTTPIQEVAPAVTYYVRGHDFKIVFDAPVLMNVPVFVENNVGAYVATEQPDQATVINPSAKGFVERQTVPEARLMFQLAF